MKKSITAGIDFGNQFCVLSMPTRYGVDIILNQSSNRKTPTIVSYDKDRRFSGEFALQQQMMSICNTITHIKRLIGLEYYSHEREELSKSIPFSLVSLKSDNLSGVQLEDGTILRPEQIAAFLLKNLLEIIQMKNSDIQQLVLTIPPWWNEIQRRLILHTASISNIKIASLLNSTTAAAIAYVKIHTDRFSDDFEKKFNTLFIDIGDTSMNVAVSTLTKRSIDMKSFVSDKTISGHFFSEKLNEYLIRKVKQKYKIDPRQNKRSFVRFQQASEKVKKALSSNSIMIFEVPSLMNDIDVSIEIKRDEFYQLFENISEKIEYVIQKALSESSFSKDDISSVELVGGASRVPAIKAVIRNFFHCEPNMSLDLDECFAVGAGYMAAKVDGYSIGIDVISSVYPFEVKVEYSDDDGLTGGPNKHSKIVFQKNSKMPSNQTFSLPVFEKRSIVLLSDDLNIGSATIKTCLSEKVTVDITVSIDSFGLINISNAVFRNPKKDDENGHKKFNAIFSYMPLNLLSKESIDEFSRIEKELSMKDKNEIEIDNTKNRLESLIFSTENELNLISVFNETDKSDIENVRLKVSEIHSWLEENEFERFPLDVYKSKITEIDEQINRVLQYKKYMDRIDFLNDLKQDLIFTQVLLKKNLYKIGHDSSIELQTEISHQMSEIENLIKLPKADIEKVEINSIEKNVSNLSCVVNSRIYQEESKEASSDQPNEHKNSDDQISLEKDLNKNNSEESKENETNAIILNQHSSSDIEKVSSQANDEVPLIDIENTIGQSVKNDILNDDECHPKPSGRMTQKNKRAINIVNINNDELGKQSLRSPRNPSLNAQKSRVKLPPMSPRCQKSYQQQQQVSQSRNKAARPILHDNIKHSPSLIHPQSQKDNNKYAARPRISATASARKPKTRK